MENLIFYIALSFILLHEMDAVDKKEWRIFPGLARLNDALGFQVFVYAHLPLYLLLFWGIWGGHGNGERVMIGMDIFFIAHVGAHLLMRNHPKNLFKGWLSWSFIIGAGLGGALDLLVRMG
jgi:hypothetical protein